MKSIRGAMEVLNDRLPFTWILEPHTLSSQYHVKRAIHQTNRESAMNASRFT